jgi:hypothetical protein
LLVAPEDATDKNQTQPAFVIILQGLGLS